VTSDATRYTMLAAVQINSHNIGDCTEPRINHLLGWWSLDRFRSTAGGSHQANSSRITSRVLLGLNACHRDWALVLPYSCLQGECLTSSMNACSLYCIIVVGLRAGAITTVRHWKAIYSFVISCRARVAERLSFEDSRPRDRPGQPFAVVAAL
jgi:hypothetical protein